MSNSTELARGVRKEGGLTLIGFVLMLIALVFVAYVAMKIVPIYINYYSVVRAMDGMHDTPGYKRKTPTQIRDGLKDRLYVSYMDDLTDKHMKITRSNGVHLRVAYQVREPILGNLDIIVSFDRSVKLN